MFVDELTIYAKAGNGGRGVVRWLREKWKPLGGPAGGNGGNGGDVFVRAVRDVGLLSKYTGAKVFAAKNGEDGSGKGRHGHNGSDCTIDLPVGSIVINTRTGERHELLQEGQTKKILSGGKGGLGNEYFKSSINRAPHDATMGREGEEAEFLVELELVVDVGLVGLPNAGKSSLLNALTSARSRVGDYPFTTLEPHLGDLRGHIIADIPGLIRGASSGKGLGHKFLRHVRRTKMLLHCISSDTEDMSQAYETVRGEILTFDSTMKDKREHIVLTKSDLVPHEKIAGAREYFANLGKNVHVVSIYDADSLKALSDALTRALREGKDSATISSHE